MLSHHSLTETNLTLTGATSGPYDVAQISNPAIAALNTQVLTFLSSKYWTIESPIQFIADIVPQTLVSGNHIALVRISFDIVFAR